MASLDRNSLLDCRFLMKMPLLEMFESQPPPPPYLKECQKPDQHGARDETNCTLAVSLLESWIDEDYLYRCFSRTGEEVVAIEMHGRKLSCGFIEFTSHKAAWRFLLTCTHILDLDFLIPNMWTIAS
ncbi:hypothetical protein M5689_020617 [Euphorbia peplus]|nr:hypothetical protein M5689_020617 [Euphorbia peplus]